MSIWSGKFWLDVPRRDDHGNEEPSPPGLPHRAMIAGESAIDISTSPNMSTVIRLSVMESTQWVDGDVRTVTGETCITPDEARRVAAALIAAADEYST